MINDSGELFSMLLRLHPTEPGMVSPSSGNQVQGAFLDMVRQGDPALAEWLHTPNQRRPYTLIPIPLLCGRIKEKMRKHKWKGMKILHGASNHPSGLASVGG